MAEFVIRLADERGRLQEQVQTAASAEELRNRFTQAGYYVYSVKPRGLTGSKRKAKLETFIIFNQQFLTLIRAGLPILGSLEMLAKGQKDSAFAGQLQNVAARVRTGESISAAFEAQGVTWGPYQGLKQAVEADPYFNAANPLLDEIDHPSGWRYLTPGSAATLPGSERGTPVAAPALGRDTDEVLTGVLGLTDGEIAGLHDRGVAGGPQ